MGLRLKILLPIVLLVVLLMSVSGYFSYSNAHKSLNDTLDTSLEREAAGFERATHSYMASAVQDISRTAGSNEVVNFLLNDSDGEVRRELAVYLENLRTTYPAQEAITLVDRQGHVAYSTKNELNGLDFSQAGYFLSALDGKRQISEVLQDRVSKLPMLIASAPVIHEGRIIGVATATIMLDEFYENVVEPIRVGERGYAYVLDKDGVLVLHKNTEWQFNPEAPLVEFYKKMAQDPQAGDMDTTTGTGSDFINRYVKESLSGFTLVLCAEKDDIFSGLNSLMASAVMVAVAGIFFGVLIVFLVVNPVVNALKKGVAFANEIAGGNLSGTLDTKRSDEIGQLVTALLTIPDVLRNIILEYKSLRDKIHGGDLSAQGVPDAFPGEFAQLVDGTNDILSQFSVLIETMPSPVIIYGKDLTATYCNKAAQELVGADYQGKTNERLLQRDDFGSPEDAFDLAVRQGVTASADTRASIGENELYISYTCIPQRGSDGKTDTIVQLVTDLTERVRVQQVMTEVAENAQGISARVAQASDELSGHIGEVSRGARIQSERAGTTAVAMEEMSATIVEIARNAAQANEQASFTREKAQSGASLVDQVVQSIVAVNTRSRELENDMKQLGEQAVNVGGVMEVISKIADQTNLLALNAAIEAARAGEAGRGFAVVADEVRKLAEQTMSATTDVESSIKGIQSSAHANIAKVTATTDEIAVVTDLSQESGTALREILELANENSSLISSIATAAEEQAATSEEITRAVDEINIITDETNSGMEQSAGAVADLSQMAQELNSLLERLRMPQEG